MWHALTLKLQGSPDAAEVPGARAVEAAVVAVVTALAVEASEVAVAAVAAARAVVEVGNQFTHRAKHR